MKRLKKFICGFLAILLAFGMLGAQAEGATIQYGILQPGMFAVLFSKVIEQMFVNMMGDSGTEYASLFMLERREDFETESEIVFASHISNFCVVSFDYEGEADFTSGTKVESIEMKLDLKGMNRIGNYLEDGFLNCFVRVCAYAYDNMLSDTDVSNIVDWAFAANDRGTADAYETKYFRFWYATDDTGVVHAGFVPNKDL